MLDYRQSIDATLSFDGVNELVHLTQDSDLGPGLGNFSLYTNGFLTQTGFGPLGLGVTYDRTFYNGDGEIVRNLSGFANEDTETNYKPDGSYTFHRFIDTGFNEDLTVNADGSGERVVTETPLGDDPTVETTDYAPGTFDVAPLQPQVEATTRLQYAFDADGHPIALRIANEDGGYTVAQFDDSTGSRIPERHLTFDASGRPVEEDRFDAAGNLAYTDHTNTDGSHTVTTYAAPSSEYESPVRLGESVRNTDGSTVDRSFDADGNVTSTATRAANGDLVKEFAAADGQHTNTYLGGKLALGELIRMDGSKEAIVFQQGVTVADTARDDVFTAYGHDTFVFGHGGDDIVKNFHANGDLSDVIRLDGVTADDVSISMVGHNTVIEIGEDASITLAGVQMTDVADNIVYA